MGGLPVSEGRLLERLRTLHLRIRDHVRAELQRSATETLAAPTEERDGDTIYVLDVGVEELLLAFCEEWARDTPFVLVAEGLPGSGELPLPRGSDPEKALFRLIVDPVDGTRGLMYDKRSAWVLSGIAPNRGEATSLADIVIAMQTELPTTRAALADVAWAVKGEGAEAETHNLVDGTLVPRELRPSRATDLRHGFATVTKYFPGNRARTAEFEERLYEELLGPAEGNPLVFDDEYICSGGQLYEVMVGHDRFVADLRPVFDRSSPAAGKARLCAHPYDLCTELIAREAGVVVTGVDGRPLAASLDIRADVAWIAYANGSLQKNVEPVLQRLLSEYAG